MAIQTKVVKVPVRINEPDDAIRTIKYRAVDVILNEARYLGNMAIRYYVAFRLKEIPAEVDTKSGKTVPIDTRVYRILAKERKFLPSACLATLARNFAATRVKTDDREAWAGKKSLPTFREKFFPFRHTGTTLVEVEESGATQFVISPDGFKSVAWLSDELVDEVKKDLDINMVSHQRPLELISTFSWKDHGSVEIVKRICSSKYKLADSMLKRTKSGLMAFLIFKHEAEQPVLDPGTICGVDLGVVVPAVCAMNNSPKRAYLGDGSDVWAARSKFRAQRKREQKRRGLYSMSKKWKRSQKEDNWIHTYYHTLTRGVIKFCIQNGCGIIQMEDLSILRSKDRENEYQRLMWMPSKFYELLSYKASEQGIEVIKINPRNTSRRCSACGHIAKDNRSEQAKFLCKKCGFKANADYNAALNIALASGDVLKNGYICQEVKD